MPSMKHILQNNLGSKHSLVTKFGQLCYITTEKFLSKKKFVRCKKCDLKTTGFELNFKVNLKKICEHSKQNLQPEAKFFWLSQCTFHIFVGHLSALCYL